MDTEIVEPTAAPEPVVEAVEKVALDIKAICEEAQAPLLALFERVKEHPDAAGLRSTIQFVIGRFEAEKQQFWR